MPISFPSKSHGQIPIGFFNIETDMLLMDHYFFFSTDFCEWVVEWIANKDANRDEKMIYFIPQKEIDLYVHSEFLPNLSVSTCKKLY